MTPAPGMVLVVDDNISLAENIAEILDAAGQAALFVSSGEAALDRLHVGDIVGIISDFRLPGMDGARLIAEVRRRGLFIPAIMMSAHTDDETISSSRNAGALLVLPKPVRIESLLGLLTLFGTKNPIGEA